MMTMSMSMTMKTKEELTEDFKKTLEDAGYVELTDKQFSELVRFQCSKNYYEDGVHIDEYYSLVIPKEHKNYNKLRKYLRNFKSPSSGIQFKNNEITISFNIKNHYETKLIDKGFLKRQELIYSDYSDKFIIDSIFKIYYIFDTYEEIEDEELDVDDLRKLILK